MANRKVKPATGTKVITRARTPGKSTSVKILTNSQVIGKQKATQAIEYMAFVGDPHTPAAKRALRKAGRNTTFSRLWPFPAKEAPIYGITEHQYGFFGIDPDHPKDDSLAIRDAGFIKSDDALRNTRVRVTLDRLRVAEYPGKGKHTVLVEFSAVHVIPTNGAKEDLRFSQKYQVEEGTGAGVRGYPIFVGLAVSSEGIALTGRTINVENAGDKGILGFLEQPIFKRGLEMINTLNPAVPVVTSMVLGISELLLKRHENIAVQSFDLGLDFSGVPSRAYLREGSYIIVQAPDEGWDWSEWQFTRSTGKLTNKKSKRPIPYNYLVIGVSKM